MSKARSRTEPEVSFQNPLVTRYASRDMAALWSGQSRYGTWRRVWLAAAEAQHALGLPITKTHLAAMRRALDDIDFDGVAEHERRTRHDVMAHIHAFGEAAPNAAGVIHMGMTSMDVVDNADLILMRSALELLIARAAATCRVLADFCEEYADLPALGFTHLQPAQLTTVGKRASLWLAEFVEDLESLAQLRADLKCRGLRGATGTQASFLKLLGSAAKVERLERDFASRLGFDDVYPVCGQTYSRKVDAQILNTLAAMAAGVIKVSNDIRLLAMLKEIEEPFETKQVGSSAMPYKRNPARCERATGLSRYLMTLASNGLITLSDQMLERTLDDSSAKRIVMPEAFLAADAILVLMENIFDGMVVYPATIAARIEAELPFIASENILMEAVSRGGNRQELHERIRAHAQAAGARVKGEAKPNDLIDRLKGDAAFKGIRWSDVMRPAAYVGLAPRQTRQFLSKRVRPLLRTFQGAKAPRTSLRV
ncbi:MAG: adenylosuccinate lyase [Phycisphaerales bacterium]|nr:adenylosuccinate lyase [Phycisphaerales bacterium]